MSEITSKEIQNLRDLRQAIGRPGQWSAALQDREEDDSAYIYCRPKTAPGTQSVICGQDWGMYLDDAKFIALAINKLPALCDLAEEALRLREEVLVLKTGAHYGEDTGQ